MKSLGWARSKTSVPRTAAASRDCRRLPVARRARRGRRIQRADADRPRARAPAADPRVGRMILEARSREALTEVLIIASAFSCRRCATGRSNTSRPPTRAQEVRRRTLRVHRRSQALAVARGQQRRAGRAQSVAAQAGAAVARQLHLAAPRARVARHPFAAAHRRRRTPMAPERFAGNLRADPPLDARRPARQHRLQERGRGLVPRRARHPLLQAPGANLSKKPGAGSSRPSWSRRRACSAAASPRSSRSGCRRSRAT